MSVRKLLYIVITAEISRSADERENSQEHLTNDPIRRRNVGLPLLGWRNKYIFQEVGTDEARPKI